MSVQLVASQPEVHDDLVWADEVDEWNEPVTDGPAGCEPRLLRAREAKVGVRLVQPHEPYDGRNNERGDLQSTDGAVARIVGLYLFGQEVLACGHAAEQTVLGQAGGNRDQVECEAGV